MENPKFLHFSDKYFT